MHELGAHGARQMLCDLDRNGEVELSAEVKGLAKVVADEPFGAKEEMWLHAVLVHTDDVRYASSLYCGQPSSSTASDIDNRSRSEQVH
jgi:hypothetical protein